MGNLIEKLSKLKSIMPLAVAVLAIISYVIPIGNPLSIAEAKDNKGGQDTKYGGVFPGKGATGGEFPGKGATGGEFPGKGHRVTDTIAGDNGATKGKADNSGNGDNGATKGKTDNTKHKK
jgi:hypothetical protein